MNIDSSCDRHEWQKAIDTCLMSALTTLHCFHLYIRFGDLVPDCGRAEYAKTRQEAHETCTGVNLSDLGTESAHDSHSGHRRLWMVRTVLNFK